MYVCSGRGQGKRDGDGELEEREIGENGEEERVMKDPERMCVMCVGNLLSPSNICVASASLASDKFYRYERDRQRIVAPRSSLSLIKNVRR